MQVTGLCRSELLFQLVAMINHYFCELYKICGFNLAPCFILASLVYASHSIVFVLSFDES